MNRHEKNFHSVVDGALWCTVAMSSGTCTARHKALVTISNHVSRFMPELCLCKLNTFDCGSNDSPDYLPRKALNIDARLLPSMVWSIEQLLVVARQTQSSPFQSAGGTCGVFSAEPPNSTNETPHTGSLCIQSSQHRAPHPRSAAGNNGSSLRMSTGRT